MLPRDPVVLLSFINTKLRDSYGSFALLCQELEVSADEITETLASIDYFYDSELNKFV